MSKKESLVQDDGARLLINTGAFRMGRFVNQDGTPTPFQIRFNWPDWSLPIRDRVNFAIGARILARNELIVQKLNYVVGVPNGANALAKAIGRDKYLDSFKTAGGFRVQETPPGTVGIAENTTTTGESVLRMIDQLLLQGFTPVAAFIAVDRRLDAPKKIAQRGLFVDVVYDCLDLARLGRDMKKLSENERIRCVRFVRRERVRRGLI